MPLPRRIKQPIPITYSQTITMIMRSVAETHCPGLLVRSNTTFAGGGTFLAAAREGGPDAITFNIHDSLRMVDPADDNSDSDRILNLEAEEYTEASIDEALDSNINMASGQASSDGNPEAIVVDGLPMEEEPSVGLIHSWKVIELYNQMGASVI